jgi:hypothetical protein
MIQSSASFWSPGRAPTTLVRKVPKTKSIAGTLKPIVEPAINRNRLNLAALREKA